MPFIGDTHFDVEPDFYDPPDPLTEKDEAFLFCLHYQISDDDYASTPESIRSRLRSALEENSRLKDLQKKDYERIKKLEASRDNYREYWYDERKLQEYKLDALQRHHSSLSTYSIVFASSVTSAWAVNQFRSYLTWWQKPVYAFILALLPFWLSLIFYTVVTSEKSGMPRLVIIGLIVVAFFILCFV